MHHLTNIQYLSGLFLLPLRVLISIVALFIFHPLAYSQQNDDPTDSSSNAYWQAELSGIKAEPKITTSRPDEFNQQLENALNNSGVQYSFGPENTQSVKLLLQGSGGIAQLRQVMFGNLPGQVELLNGPVNLKISAKAIRNHDIAIILESNPSTGYRWEFAGADKENLIRKEDSKYEVRGSHPGATAKQRIILRSLNDEENSINLVYRRPWEANATAKNQLKMQITDLPEVMDLSDPSPLIQAEFDRSAPSANTPLAAIGALPASWDWRVQAGGLTPVRDQGACGSCWAFSTVGALESALKAKLGLATNLSEQFLISCNQSGWSCNGGWWAHSYHANTLGAMQAVAGGVLEEAMPYTATNGTCTTVTDHSLHIGSWNYVAGYSVPTVDQLKTAISTYGPVSASVCVGNAFQSYRGGIFATDEKANCGGGGVNHGIVLVGWNDTEQTWILRNSWGTWWGEQQGYMRIKWEISNVGYGASYVSDPYTSSANTFTLTVSKAGAGVGTVTSAPAGINCGSTCLVNYADGTVVTLTAVPATGASFAGWSGACSGTGNCQVTMSKASAVTATFSQGYPLTISKAGAGAGAVTSKPAGIDCGSTCSASYTTGTYLTLTATPAAGSVFAGWSGGSCSGTWTCYVTMNQARAVTATFK